MQGKIVCTNREASFQYFILERLEAGIVLEGSEIKSLRKGNVSLKDSFCMLQHGEMYIKNMHIAVYENAGAFNSKDSRRDRKILLHREEINKLYAKISQKGLTLVPLKIYFKQALAKIELGLCQGKHTYDKKRSIMENDIKREKEREIKNYR